MASSGDMIRAGYEEARQQQEWEKMPNLDAYKNRYTGEIVSAKGITQMFGEIGLEYSPEEATTLDKIIPFQRALRDLWMSHAGIPH